ncbi:MAG TPA: ATP-binding cassette domain-containing protein [Armatimonadota bacterium]|nr:ATP-binding cassette domain-containing protein [Armatimonadota bacterium]
MIAVDGISKTYGARHALEPTTIAFSPGETTVLIGPSGCGKSTMLRIIMGLITPDTGRVLLDLGPGAGSDAGPVEMTRLSANSLRHAMGYVIQDGGLFPHLTAEHNVTLLARYLERDENQIRDRLKALADLTQLPAALLRRYPTELSGGQRQRVGLMRALMLDPPILVLDEPLGALDPITRYELQGQLKGIFAQLKKTVILVTHDMGEAIYFGAEIVLMRDGRVAQRGTPGDLLERPAEPFVSEFIRAQRSPLPQLLPEG